MILGSYSDIYESINSSVPSSFQKSFTANNLARLGEGRGDMPGAGNSEARVKGLGWGWREPQQDVFRNRLSRFSNGPLARDTKIWLTDYKSLLINAQEVKRLVSGDLGLNAYFLCTGTNTRKRWGLTEHVRVCHVQFVAITALEWRHCHDYLWPAFH